MTDASDPAAFAVLATRTVSDKTARDGRLEIGERAARQLLAIGALTADLEGVVAAARVDRFECDCREDKRHFYVESAAFKRVPIGVEVTLNLDAPNRRILILRKTTSAA